MINVDTYVNETEQVQKRDSRYREQIELPNETSFGLGIEVNNGLASTG